MNTGNYHKLEKQPLLFVLAEFRFPVIMKMEQHIPELQESFRSEFPHFEEQVSQEVKLQSQMLEVGSHKQWGFIDKNRRKAVVINPSRIICMTSCYDRFDGFSTFCLESLEILKTITNPAFVERIGLRYADLVVPVEQYQVSALVQQDLYDVAHLNGVGELSHKFNEILLKTDEGDMMIRSLYGNHNLSVLSDVTSIPIKLNTIESKLNGECRVILDFDHIWEAGEEAELIFDKNIILEKLEKMHSLSRKAFWNCTTEEGRELWK